MPRKPTRGNGRKGPTVTDDELHTAYWAANGACAQLYALVTEKQNEWSRGNDPYRAYTYGIAGIRGAEMMKSLHEFHVALLDMRRTWQER